MGMRVGMRRKKKSPNGTDKPWKWRFFDCVERRYIFSMKRR